MSRFVKALLHKHMRILIGPILLLAACSAPATDPVATAIVSKDSVVIHITVKDHDAVWEWNKQPEGTVEHQWVVRMPIRKSEGWPFDGDYHVAVVQTSSGPPVLQGDVKDLIKNGRVTAWVIKNGDRPSGDTEGYSAHVKPTYEAGAIRFAFYRGMYVEQIKRTRHAGFRMRGVRADGSEYEGSVRVTNLKDPREQAARTISGPFTPDEYAIYQTIIDRAFDTLPELVGSRPDFVLVSPSADAEPRQTEIDHVKGLGASDDAVRNYLEKRSVKTDMSSLAAIGYRIIDADTLSAQLGWAMRQGKPWIWHVGVSLIGLNNARNLALVYMYRSSGNLGGDGHVICLNKVDGEWLVTRRVMLWIS